MLLCQGTKGVIMSDNPKRTILSPERVERTIIRRIGRTRYAELCLYIQENVDVAFLMKEFSLEAYEVHSIREHIQSNEKSTLLRIQTN